MVEQGCGGALVGLDVKPKLERSLAISAQRLVASCCVPILPEHPGTICFVGTTETFT